MLNISHLVKKKFNRNHLGSGYYDDTFDLPDALYIAVQPTLPSNYATFLCAKQEVRKA